MRDEAVPGAERCPDCGGPMDDSLAMEGHECPTPAASAGPGSVFSDDGNLEWRLPLNWKEGDDFASLESRAPARRGLPAGSWEATFGEGGVAVTPDRIRAWTKLIGASLSSPDAAAVRHEAAREALTALANRLWEFARKHEGFWVAQAEDIWRFRDREYPAPPAAPRSVRPIPCALCGGDTDANDGVGVHTHREKCISSLRSQVESLASTLAGTK